MNDFQTFIHVSRYARWVEWKQRRETWWETVERYIDFFSAKFTVISQDTWLELKTAIYNMEIMPSMRALMTAGPALEQDQVAGYNCGYRAIDDPRAFDEIMYILMCGTGVGFSVENHNVDKLPVIPELVDDRNYTIEFEDSRIGWAGGFREFVSCLYSGRVPGWDLGNLRPAGARLKTFGGRASGPEPLADLLVFTRDLFRHASGRRLTSLECHDLVCKIADIVVVGGVRRSALISLSDLEDDKMRYAKSGRWWETAPHRALANNSVAYKEKPPVGSFMREMLALYDSQSGERGIFNREAASNKAASIGRDPDHEWGTNPCGEILLRSKQFCNLTEVVLRPEDTVLDVARKVRLAATLGTIQSALTDFRYLSDGWKQNCEEERLLGVSLTGIMDCAYNWRIWDQLPELREVAGCTNILVAQKLGIPPSSAITCVKPSGTVSQLVDSSSGIHPRYAPYYIRTVRADNMDPLCQFLKDQGVPHEPDVTKPNYVSVFSFPQKSPEKAVCTKDVTALAQLEWWETLATEWCDHNPSITVHVKEEEWVEVFNWVYANWDVLCGVAFLPYQDHVYKQAPYQEITEEEYNQLVEQMPRIKWNELEEYELSDHTTGSHDLACSSGSCEVVDLTGV
jgi:ribonucleoside-diphosphate reductase alpha chain